MEVVANFSVSFNCFATPKSPIFTSLNYQSVFEEEQVFDLDVSVDDVRLVDVVQAHAYLYEYFQYCLLAQRPVALEVDLQVACLSHTPPSPSLCTFCPAP